MKGNDAVNSAIPEGWIVLLDLVRLLWLNLMPTDSQVLRRLSLRVISPEVGVIAASDSLLKVRHEPMPLSHRYVSCLISESVSL